MSVASSQEFENVSSTAGGGHKSWESAKQYYNQWAVTYDKDHLCYNYDGPRIAALTVKKYESNKLAKILDVACGTGFVGEHLKLLGYTCIDGLDGSEEMLKQAQSKGVYKNLISECLSPEPSQSIGKNTYDVTVMSGAFGGGHLAADIWKELIRITKPGGHIINMMREKWLMLEAYKDKLEAEMDQLVTDGKWVKISRERVEKYVYNDSGVLHVYIVN